MCITHDTQLTYWWKANLVYQGDAYDPPASIIGSDLVKSATPFRTLGLRCFYYFHFLTQIERRPGLAAGVVGTLSRALRRRRDNVRSTKLRVSHATIPVCPNIQRLKVTSQPVLFLLFLWLWVQRPHRVGALLWSCFQWGTMPEDQLAEYSPHHFSVLYSLAWSRPTTTWCSHYQCDPLSANWRRPRGRPRRRWNEVVRKNLQQINNWGGCFDIENWRDKVVLLVKTPSWHDI